MKPKQLVKVGIGLILSMFFISTAYADSITPESLTKTIKVGESVTVTKTITLDPGALTANKVDVFFLSDVTGSMSGIINSVKTNAATILSAISGGDSRFTGINVGFGVGEYWGDPKGEGLTATDSYRLQQAITTDSSAVQTAINSWSAGGGGDLPEGNFFALQQVATNGAATATGYSTGYDTAWRSGAGKVVVWFGDAYSHEETINQADTIAALQAAGVTVAAINTAGSGSGIDAFGQASAVTSETGGTLTNNVGGTSTTLDAILAAVESATSSLNLTLDFDGDHSGVGINFTPSSYPGVVRDATDPLTFTFDLTFTGLTAGVYDFNTLVPGLNDVFEHDIITVTATTVATPEPGTLLLVSAGILGLAYARRRMNA